MWPLKTWMFYLKYVYITLLLQNNTEQYNHFYNITLKCKNCEQANNSFYFCGYRQKMKSQNAPNKLRKSIVPHLWLNFLVCVCVTPIKHKSICSVITADCDGWCLGRLTRLPHSHNNVWNNASLWRSRLKHNFGFTVVCWCQTGHEKCKDSALFSTSSADEIIWY